MRSTKHTGIMKKGLASRRLQGHWPPPTIRTCPNLTSPPLNKTSSTTFKRHHMKCSHSHTYKYMHMHLRIFQCKSAIYREKFTLSWYRLQLVNIDNKNYLATITRLEWELLSTYSPQHQLQQPTVHGKVLIERSEILTVSNVFLLQTTTQILSSLSFYMRFQKSLGTEI